MNIKISMLILLTTLCLAEGVDERITNVKLGIAQSNTQLENETDNLYFGADLMFDSKGFSFGIGFDYIGLQSNRNSSSNYIAAPQIKVGYNLEELTTLPILLKADVGYGVTRYEDENHWQAQYGGSIEIKLYKGLGAGIGYKYVDTDTRLGEVDNTMAYLSLFF